jgi:dimeric dUTPase (all-alpha-NTP-PPase superfamily)
MKFISNEICKICFFQMQRKHRLALTKNYVLLVNETRQTTYWTNSVNIR